jgi:hypothetical protein
VEVVVPDIVPAEEMEALEAVVVVLLVLQTVGLA